MLSVPHCERVRTLLNLRSSPSMLYSQLLGGRQPNKLKQTFGCLWAALLVGMALAIHVCRNPFTEDAGRTCREQLSFACHCCVIERAAGTAQTSSQRVMTAFAAVCSHSAAHRIHCWPLAVKDTDARRCRARSSPCLGMIRNAHAGWG